jgi:formiminotetrahydrofolate cyclodeaminase
MEESTSTIEAFLEAAAAKTPTPGGGSITALVGALSAAMGEMVLNYSVGKKSLEAYQDELRPALAELTRARRMMLQLLVEDQAAYEALARVQKLPADSPQRREQLDPALLASIRVPQAMSAAAVAVLEICDRVVNFVNYHLLSDLAVCADLAMAVARCANYSVRVNLKSVTDEADRRSVEAMNSQMLSHAAVLIQRISPRIWARDAQG